MKNFLARKNAYFFLVMLWLFCSQSFFVKSDLHDHIKDLSDNLHSLKKKLGELGNHLSNLKTGLEGKPGPAPLTAVPVEAVAPLKGKLSEGKLFGKFATPKQCEIALQLITTNDITDLLEKISKSAQGIKDAFVSTFDKSFDSTVTMLKANGLSQEQAELVEKKTQDIVQLVQAQDCVKKVLTSKFPLSSSLTLKPTWVNKDAKFKATVIDQALGIVCNNLLDLPPQQRIAKMIEMGLIDKNIETLSEEIASANKSDKSTEMDSGELKKLKEDELPVVLTIFKNNLGIDQIKADIAEIITIAQKPSVGIARAPGSAAPPMDAPKPASLSKKDFEFLVTHADMLWGTSDDKTGFFNQTKIKSELQKRVKTSLDRKQTTNVDELTQGIDPKLIERLKQSLGMVKMTSGGPSEPKPTGPTPKPTATIPAGYEDVWDNLSLALANPSAFGESINKAINEISNPEKMKENLNTIPGLHNLLIAMDSNRPEGPAVGLLKAKWKPVLQAIQANLQVKAWFIEQMKKDRLTAKGAIAYAGNSDFSEADWDNRVNAILTAPETVKKARGGDGSAGGSGGVIPELKGGIDLLDIPNFEEFYMFFMNNYFNKDLAGSRFGQERSRFWLYTNEMVSNIKNYISRACFEKNILDYCKAFIDEHDPARAASGQNPTWLYDNYLRSAIQLTLGGIQKEDIIFRNDLPKEKKAILNAALPKEIMAIFGDALSKEKEAILNAVSPEEVKAIVNVSEEGIASILNDSKKVKIILTIVEKMQTVLRAATELAVQSVNDMFYHKERQAGIDRVGCDCLTDSLQKRCYTQCGVEELPESERIPLNHPLYNPIQYLIFETMHITLFHGFHFINKLIPLFDFTKDITADVSVEGKTRFRIGFDAVFEAIMNYIVNNDDEIRAGLMFDTQKDFRGDELTLSDGNPREVFYGAKTGFNGRARDYYWCQMGAEKFPDGKERTRVDGYQNFVTADELRYAVKYHLFRHTCYSVGLIPYNIVHMFKLPPEQEADVLEIIADASNNDNEKKRLKAKAKGLRRVPYIVNYLAEWKPGKINLAGAVGQGNVADSFRTHLENMKDSAGKVKILTSITQDEWLRIFDIFSSAQENTESPDDAPENKFSKAWNDKIRLALSNAKVKKLLEQQLENTKYKDPVTKVSTPVTDLIFGAFDTYNK